VIPVDEVLGAVIGTADELTGQAAMPSSLLNREFTMCYYQLHSEAEFVDDAVNLLSDPNA